ncbi:5-methyltetrahydrofolate--homocysteine methyltransferase, putative [Babesia caballi]|uniref:5-methyltetrahydrofolate--homocysteine methyltransferase, putative n=1 Tax=Babesia caballi TaxID=5871 RepID=A0AAV4M2N4_BABCB|nr:5-methyltetrahydrofolate--homocysteine methyltransferase, putative [Babesia caballi]
MLDRGDLRANILAHRGTHVGQNVTEHGPGKLTRLLHSETVQQTVQHGASEEVTSASSVHNLNTSGGNEVTLAAEDYVGTLTTHGNDDSLVLQLADRSKVLEVKEQLLLVINTVQLRELLKVAAQVCGLGRNRLQVLTVLPDANAVREQSYNLFPTAKGSVDHLVSESNVTGGTEHETVNDVVVVVVHHRRINVLGHDGPGRTE